MHLPLGRAGDLDRDDQHIVQCCVPIGAHQQSTHELVKALHARELVRELSFAYARHLLGLVAVGDVLDPEQDQTPVVQAPTIEQHDSPAQLAELPLDVVVIERAIVRQHGIELRAQRFNVPVSVAEFEESATLGLRR